MRLIDVWCCFALRCAAMAETPMIPFVAADQVRAALPYPALMDALRVAFAEADQVQVPRRHAHTPALSSGSRAQVIQAPLASSAASSLRLA